ncbi:Ribulose-phosphate 3-epimerase [groundwater metagenome]|uniref:ribulose-phosphate 3-epimerase n=1 Tax=groundwater metagenome TaxID=717931 RepID=A0A098E8F6_9ZZZZ
MPIISTSILSANFTCLKDEIERIRNTDMIHIDVMDGIFVPNLTFGQVIIKTTKNILRDLNLKILSDVHLMVVNPHEYIKEFHKMGADSITFHYEAYRNIEKCNNTIKLIKNFGIKAGIAINPETYLPEEELNILLTEGKPNILLIMGVHPGYSGQKFINEVFEKIKKSKKTVDDGNSTKNLDMKIAVDGGVKFRNVDKIIENGADIVVIGSEIFEGNPDENIQKIKKK